MRVLALADKPPPLAPDVMATQMKVDAVVCLGDLDRAWIEPLTWLRLPKLGVHGNHDPPDLLLEVEVDDLHGRRTSLGGMTFAGFEGCVKYGGGGPHHYTQREASKLARRLPGADVLADPLPAAAASTTIPTIPRTSGSRACSTGSSATSRGTSCTATRTRSASHVMKRFGATRVHWISGARVVQL